MTAARPPAGVSSELVVTALGVDVSVALAQPWLTSDDQAALRRLWSRSEPPGTSDRTATVPPEAVSRARDLRGLAASLSTEVTLAAITERAGELVMLHAAGVADPAGHTVALVGPSGRGKTTASRVLGRCWGYLSDETVGCEPWTGRVVAHPKPLSIRTGSGHKDQRSPDELGLLPAPPACTLTRIVLLCRDPHWLGAPELTPVPLVSALGELTAELSYLDRLPSPLRTLADLIERTHGVLRVRYADAEDLPAVLPDLLTAHLRQEDWWPGGSSGSTAERARPFDPQPVADAVTDGLQEAVLLASTDARGPRIVVLAGIGPALRDLAVRGVPYESWAAELTATHGAPPSGEPDAVVAAVVEDLVAAGVLHDGTRS